MADPGRHDEQSVLDRRGTRRRNVKVLEPYSYLLLLFLFIILTPTYRGHDM